MVVDGGIKFSDNVVEHARRERENGPAITAVGRMTDAVRRSFRKEDGLVDVSGQASPAEVLGKRAMADEDDVVAARALLCRGSTAAGAALVVSHTDDRAVVERVECEQVFIAAGRNTHRYSLFCNVQKSLYASVL